MRTKMTLASLAFVLLTTAALVRPPSRHLAGSVSGTVTYTGTAPKMKPIDMAKEPSCASQHPTPATTEIAVTGPGNTLANVVVYVSAGDQASTAPAQPVRYDQKGCTYVPHVAVLHTNQPLEISNSDQTSHNIHPLGKTNAEWNKSQPPGSPPLVAKYDKPEFIAVKCNVHPWMHGYFAVLSTNHSGVSGNDGAFSLSGLPPGKYTLTAWHEKFGTQTQDITITANETAKVNFVFTATPY